MASICICRSLWIDRAKELRECERRRRGFSVHESSAINWHFENAKWCDSACLIVITGFLAVCVVKYTLALSFAFVCSRSLGSVIFCSLIHFASRMTHNSYLSLLTHFPLFTLSFCYSISVTLLLCYPQLRPCFFSSFNGSVDVLWGHFQWPIQQRCFETSFFCYSFGQLTLFFFRM